MTTLRKEAYNLLERMPENKLYFLVEIMQGIEGLEEIEVREKPVGHSLAFQELEKLRRPIPDLDDEKELASWREEKFGYAGVA